MKRSHSTTEEGSSKRAKVTTVESDEGNASNMASKPKTSSNSMTKSTSEESTFHDVDSEILGKSPSKWKVFTEKELPGGEVFYLADFLDERTANEWFQELEALETCK